MGAIFRAIFGYCFLVFVIRVENRRPGRQMTPFEYVLIFYLGGLTLTTMIGDDRSLTNALCVVATVALTHLAFSIVRKKFPKVGFIVDGMPVVLMKKGQWDEEALLHLRVTDDDVMAAARDQGLKTLDDIDYAVQERNGQISIIPNKDK